MAVPDPAQRQQGRNIVHLPTFDTYNRWAATYDSDGNILQALDSYALTQSMFRFLVQTIPSNDAQPDSSPDNVLYITDLGCGTGRATLLLLAALSFANDAAATALAAKGYRSAALTGVDGSSGMLGVASQRIPPFVSFTDGFSISTQLFESDLLDSNAVYTPVGGHSARNTTATQINNGPEPAHVIISTLVLEHLPLKVYFERSRAMLRPGGLLLVTNMHDKMGTSVFSPAAESDAPANFISSTPQSVSQSEVPIPTGAGFNDAATNTKIRAQMDFAHAIDDVVSAAKSAGFELVDDRVDELSVEPWMFEQGSSGQAYGDSSRPLLGPRGMKWVGTPCWFGMIFRRSV